MAKMLWKALKVGFKLFLIGLIVAIPMIIINAILTLIFGAIGLVLGGWFVTLMGLVMFIPLLVADMIAYGWLVLKWRRWVFA